MSITIPGIGTAAAGVHTVHASDIDPTGVSQHMPPLVVAALLRAAAACDTDEIDRITDTLVQDGLCRPRSDTSRLGELRERCQS